jgi:hypothetical protein
VAKVEWLRQVSLSPFQIAQTDIRILPANIHQPRGSRMAGENKPHFLQEKEWGFVLFGLMSIWGGLKERKRNYEADNYFSFHFGYYFLERKKRLELQKSEEKIFGKI